MPPSVDQIIQTALEEDLGRGDITTRLTIPQNAKGNGRVIARQDMVVSGLSVFAKVNHFVDPSLALKLNTADGDNIKNGALIAEVSGAIASLLQAERVSLNFLQRLCGVSTLTRRFVDALPKNSKTKIADTRKTTPGLRFMERQAVLHGGGQNHRVDLAGGILIKENHIVAAGSIKEAVKKCLNGAPHPLLVEVEVQNITQLQEALDAGAQAVLLDNMTANEISKCVALVNGRAIVEASGGVNLKTLFAIAAAGVDVISVGALTHSAPAADISFLIDDV